MTLEVRTLKPEELEQIKRSTRRSSDLSRRRRSYLAQLQLGESVFFAGRTPQQLTRYYTWAREEGFEVSMAQGIDPITGDPGTAIYRNDEKESPDGDD